MAELMCYKTLPEWDHESLPKAFQKRHNTKAGVWAKLIIFSGSLRYYSLDGEDNILDEFLFDSNSDIPYIAPQAWHKIEPRGEDLRCQIQFYCKPVDYYHKKYGLTPVHSEMFEVINYIQSGDALDIGCGRGRNALFLQQQGFNVTAFDRNADSIQKLQSIIDEEKLNNIHAVTDNANDANIEGMFDLIFSTVVFMFLNEQHVAGILNTMREKTRMGGYNLIVSALDCDEYPLPKDFLSFGFQPNELKHYYQGWRLKKYNEDIGHLHRRDSAGNRIALRFVTMIAQKR